MTLSHLGLALTLLLAALAVCSRTVRVLHGLTFTFCVLAAGSAALTHPPLFLSWGGFEMKRVISPLVQVILLGMGLTLTIHDFGRAATMPRAVALGLALQFSVMPLSGLVFASLFGLTGPVATGLILVGSVPGGTASNVIAMLARANVPLSVTMTACSTLISPFMTPLLMKVLAGTHLLIDGWAMTQSILIMVIAPLAVGLVVHHLLPGWAERLARWLPLVAMGGICMVIGITVAASRDELLSAGAALFAASACHNATGYILAYGIARTANLSHADARTVALEVGIQNGGMATALAFDVLKSPAAALASAVFGPWSAITSSVLASWWRRTPHL